jgi:hypothetical protein
MNYQYRYGTSTSQAIRTLYLDGGWTRYYQGLSAALIQGPVSRFGDTAANAGIFALLNSNSYMKKMPTLVKSGFAALAAAAFRMILTPIDTVKTTLQTQGKPGMQILKTRVRLFLSVRAVLLTLYISGKDVWYRLLVVRRVRHRCCDFRWSLPRQYPPQTLGLDADI